MLDKDSLPFHSGIIHFEVDADLYLKLLKIADVYFLGDVCFLCRSIVFDWASIVGPFCSSSSRCGGD